MKAFQDENQSVSSLMAEKHSLTSNYRKRTKFADNQLKILESKFQESSYISGERLDYLVKNLGLTRKNIKIWFQNRRARQKKYNASSIDTINHAMNKVFNDVYYKIPSNHSQEIYNYYPVNMIPKRQYGSTYPYDTMPYYYDKY